MKTKDNDPILDDELQEMYIESTHWSSDLRFEEDEIRFLKKMVQIFFKLGEKTDHAPVLEEFNKRLEDEAVTIAYLKIELAELLKSLSPLVRKSNQKIGLNLIESFTKLDREIKIVFEETKEIKRSLFALTEEILKANPRTTHGHLTSIRQ